jgi:hypothetical protein
MLFAVQLLSQETTGVKIGYNFADYIIIDESPHYSGVVNPKPSYSITINYSSKKRSLFFFSTDLEYLLNRMYYKESSGGLGGGGTREADYTLHILNLYIMPGISFVGEDILHIQAGVFAGFLVREYAKGSRSWGDLLGGGGNEELDGPTDYFERARLGIAIRTGISYPVSDRFRLGADVRIGWNFVNMRGNSGGKLKERHLTLSAGCTYILRQKQ